MAREKKKSEIKPVELLFTIVDRGQGEKYVKFYQEYDVTYQVIILGRGTANSSIMNYLGLIGSDKDIVLSLLKVERKKEILDHLQEDLKIFGKGIAFTIPLDSIIGRNVYNFIIHETNKRGDRKYGK